MVLEKIFEHARAAPGRRALDYGPRRISYGELASWVADAREFLGQHDVRGGGMAVLNVDSLVDSWVLGLALRSLGLTTFAVESLDAVDRLGLRDIVCIVASARESPPRPASAGPACKRILIPQHFYLGKPTGGVPNLPEAAFAAGAHVLTTSGTTGTRKKVLIDDHHLAGVIKRRAVVYGVSERSVVNVFGFAQWTGAGYKMPACAWSLGGSVVIHQWQDPHKSLHAKGITHAFFTPGTLAELLKAPQGEVPRSESMRAFVGGGPLPRALAAEARTRLTPHIFTYIGSTEIGPWALTPIARDEDLRAHSIHPSVEVEAVDERGTPLPAGRMGALRIRTPDMVAGYIGDEAASRAAFRDGYFYSGDLGTFQEDGRLVLHGRADNVINVLGSKMAAETIEMAIQESLAAEGVCVLSRRSDGTDEEVHVAVEARRPIENAELARVFAVQLPGLEHVRVHFLAPMPRTDTGKIDRSAVKRKIFPAASA